MAKVIGYALIIIGSLTTQYGGTSLIYAGQAILAVDAIEQNRRQRRRAKALANGALQDRLEMVESDPQQPRTIVYGRVRTVEGVRRRWVSGENSQRLTMIVSFAGHEIDAFEKFYFNDIELTLNGSGYVMTEPFRKVGTEVSTYNGTWPAPGPVTVTLPVAPLPGAVSASGYDSGGEGGGSIPLTVDSVVGNVVTISGGGPGLRYAIAYDYGTGESKARIRPYLGTDLQNVGADLASEYPGNITATDRFAGIALAVIDIDFDPDVFPQGRPNVTAVLRGKKVYDPSKDSTAGGSGSHRLADKATWEFSERPALHAYDYARNRNGWAVPPEEINTADVILARNVCAEVVDFPVDGSTVTLPRYQCGIVISTAGDPRDGMAEIIESMAGRHGWAGGVWRLRAGHMPTPAFAMDESWLAKRMQEDGTLDQGPTLTFTNGTAREAKVNRITGSCVDPSQRWQVLPFPAVEDPVLIAAEGDVYPLEVEYQGVNTITHAQHLAKVQIKRTQAPLMVDAQCNLNAYGVEMFDVGTMTLPSYAISGKTMEVLGWRWSPTEGPALRMREITQEIFDPVDELTGRDPAPNTNLPSAWIVEPLTGLAVTSGATADSDGSVLTRTRITWDQATTLAVRVGGKAELQFAQLVDDGEPIAWQIWEEDGGATVAVINALNSRATYLFRGRFQSGPPFRVRGPWSASVQHKIAAPEGGGGDGAASYMIEIYCQKETAPATPVGGTYTFTGDVFVPPGALADLPVWSLQTVTSRAHSTVAAINGVIVIADSSATGGNAYFQYSTDGGLTWGSAGPYSASFNNPQVAANNGRFVSRLSGTQCAYSTDGQTWTTATHDGNDANREIIVGFDKFYFFNSTFTQFLYTTDGSTFSTGTCTSGTGNICGAFGNSTLVVHGSVGSGPLAHYSTDSVNFTAATTPPAFEINRCAYGAGRFIGLKFTGSITYDFSYSTDNGVTWATGSFPTNADWREIIFAQGRFIVLSLPTGGATIKTLYSTDGITWTVGTSTNVTAGSLGANRMAYDGNGSYVAIRRGQSDSSINRGYAAPADVWSRNQPNGSAVPTYATRQLATTTTPATPITLGTWAVPNRHVRDGEAGENTPVLVTLFIYKNSAAPSPSTPGSASYDIATGALSSLSGWSVTRPDFNPLEPTYTSSARITVTGLTGTISVNPLLWASPVRDTGDGPGVAALSTYLVSFSADSAGVVDAGQSALVAVRVMKGAYNDVGEYTITASASDASLDLDIVDQFVTITPLDDNIDGDIVEITASRTGYDDQVMQVAVVKARRSTVGPTAGYMGDIGQLSDVYAYADTGTASARLLIETNGRMRKRINGASAEDILPGINYYLPTTSGIGTTTWCRVTKLNGATLAAGTLGTWQQLTGQLEYRGELSGTGDRRIMLRVEYSTASGGSPIVCTALVDLVVEFG